MVKVCKNYYQLDFQEVAAVPHGSTSTGLHSAKICPACGLIDDLVNADTGLAKAILRGMKRAAIIGLTFLVCRTCCRASIDSNLLVPNS